MSKEQRVVVRRRQQVPQQQEERRKPRKPQYEDDLTNEDRALRPCRSIVLVLLGFTVAVWYLAANNNGQRRDSNLQNHHHHHHHHHQHNPKYAHRVPRSPWTADGNTMCLAVFDWDAPTTTTFRGRRRRRPADRHDTTRSWHPQQQRPICFADPQDWRRNHKIKSVQDLLAENNQCHLIIETFETTDRNKSPTWRLGDSCRQESYDDDYHFCPDDKHKVNKHDTVKPSYNPLTIGLDVGASQSPSIVGFPQPPPQWNEFLTKIKQGLLQSHSLFAASDSLLNNRQTTGNHTAKSVFSHANTTTTTDKSFFLSLEHLCCTKDTEENRAYIAQIIQSFHPTFIMNQSLSITFAHQVMCLWQPLQQNPHNEHASGDDSGKTLPPTTNQNASTYYQWALVPDDASQDSLFALVRHLEQHLATESTRMRSGNNHTLQNNHNSTAPFSPPPMLCPCRTGLFHIPLWTMAVQGNEPPPDTHVPFMQMIQHELDNFWLADQLPLKLQLGPLSLVVAPAAKTLPW